ncbi:U-box domain-containing protein 1-like [Tasmannia lanceolata]|uniref:U-box domain-containing protein 1-like n=1 Tax=Tasmannia lanceolata TaxID=3420 RepID=UPI0040645655
MEAKQRTIKSLIKRLSSDSDQTQSEAISELRLLSKLDPETRTLISDLGAIPFLAQSLYSQSTQENGIATLLNLSISNRELLMSTPGLLDALSHVLRSGNFPATSTAAATIHSLLIEPNYRPIIGSKPSILTPLIYLIHAHPNSPIRSIKDPLKALFSISLYPLNRPKLVELGVVPPLFMIVLKDRRAGVVEDATAVIAQVGGCYESVEAFRKLSGIEILVDLLDVDSGSTSRVRENSVSALLNLVQCGGENAAQDIRDMGSLVLHGISDMAENGSSRAKVKAGALLKVLAARGSSERERSNEGDYWSGILNSSSYSSDTL